MAIWAPKVHAILVLGPFGFVMMAYGLGFGVRVPVALRFSILIYGVHGLKIL